MEAIGLSTHQFELKCGDSKRLIPNLAKQWARRVDIYLVDGDHTYEGALADIRNGLPMLKSGGFILVQDMDRDRRMDEMTPEHPHPVYEAFHKIVRENNLKWCILKFIRKHLGVIQVG